VQDGSKIWWDLRPSSHCPTLEMRICDVCPNLEDALAIAALYQCILRMLYRLRISNQRWCEYPNMLIQENRWLAQRYGSRSELVDFGKRSLIPYADLLEEILSLVAEDADALGCVAEVEHARTIVQRGTSAEQQLDVYRDAGGADRHQEAMHAVVLDVARRTVAETA